MLVRGYASTPRLTSDSHRIAAGAFDVSIAVRGLAGIRLLFDHDKSRPIGRITVLEQRPEGLWIEAMVTASLPTTTVWGFSIGGFKKRYRREPDKTLLIHSFDLREVSITEWPRNSDCKLEIVRTPGVALWPEGFETAFDRPPAEPLKLPAIRYEEQST